jgi:Xaa-Pro aminopeptidase
MSDHPRIATRISDIELERRWAAVREVMKAHRLDAIIAQATNDWLGGNVKWLTDIPANNHYPRTVIFHADDLMTIVEMGVFGGERKLEGKDAIHRGVGKILTVPSFPSINYTVPYDADLAAGELQRRGSKRVGLMTPGGFLAGFHQRLTQALEGIELIDATDALDSVKAIKSAEERALIRRAASLQDAVFAEVCAFIRPGLRDIDVTTHAQAFAQKLGSEQGIFLGASAKIGLRSPFMGRHLQNKVLESGDHLSLLIEINGPGGMYTEIARTLCLGKASQQLLDGFAAVKAAQDYTLSLIRPGVLCRDIAAAHDAYMIAHDMPPEIRLYSHGQGYDMVERPLIRHDEDMAIAEHMNLAVHPGFENDAIFAVICDNYLVEAHGPSACLHATEKKIFEL